MELLRDGEVVAVIVSGSDPHQMLLSVAPVRAFGADRLGAADREISDCT
jgi:hypothetical protein